MPGCSEDGSELCRLRRPKVNKAGHAAPMDHNDSTVFLYRHIPLNEMKYSLSRGGNIILTLWRRTERQSVEATYFTQSVELLTETMSWHQNMQLLI
jgi:hypothetical protein